MADPNQITAMIHFLGSENKTVVGTVINLASPQQEGGKICCIAELGPMRASTAISHTLHY